MDWRMTFLGVVAAATLTGCASASHPSDASGAEPKISGVSAYMCRGAGEADFIQWTGDHELTGTMDIERIQGAPPNERVSQETVDLTGTRSGATLTLSLDGKTVFGSLSKKSLTLRVTGQGGVQTGTCDAVTADAFNAAVSKLTAAVSTANDVANREAQAQQAGRKLDAAYQAVITDEQDLASDAAALAPDVSSAQADLASMQKDEAEALRASADEICVDADSVDSDLDGLESDADGVSNDQDPVTSEMNTLYADLGTLSIASGAGYSGASATSAQVNDALNGAGAIAVKNASIANNAIDAMNQVLRSGYALDQTASAAGHCNSVTGPPTYLQHVTVPE